MQQTWKTNHYNSCMIKSMCILFLCQYDHTCFWWNRACCQNDNMTTCLKWEALTSFLFTQAPVFVLGFNLMRSTRLCPHGSWLKRSCDGRCATADPCHAGVNSRTHRDQYWAEVVRGWFLITQWRVEKTSIPFLQLNNLNILCISIFVLLTPRDVFYLDLKWTHHKRHELLQVVIFCDLLYHRAVWWSQQQQHLVDTVRTHRRSWTTVYVISYK